MKRFLPATLIGAILAIGSFGAIAANAATPTNTPSAILAEAPDGTETAAVPGDTQSDPAGGLDSQVDFQGDSQSDQ